MNDKNTESHTQGLNWYKKQVENCLLQADEHFKLGDVKTGNYFENEARLYQQRVTELENN